MPLQAIGPIQTGTAGTDYLLGITGGPDHTLNGLGGNDILFGDSTLPFIDTDHGGNDTIAGAVNIDAASY